MVEPHADAVLIAGRAADLRAVLFPIPAKHIGQGSFIRLLVFSDPRPEVKLSQLVLGDFKL